MYSFSKPKPSYYRQLYYITQLKRHQWFRENVLLGIQEKRLRALTNHAYQNVPFYHNLFDSAGIKPQDVKSLKDLQKIPILTKEIVRNNYPDKIVDRRSDKKNCIFKSTTGSTGVPLEVCFSSKGYDYSSSSYIFAFLECGLRLTDKLVSIRHQAYISDSTYLFKILLQKMGIFNWENISIFNPVESILESLRKSKPDVISTYPSMLLILSKKIKEQNISGINPRLILTGGETLTDNNQNEIRKVFNSDIYRLYGTEEFSRLAFECKENSGYHIISDAVIIEVVKENRNVEAGEEGEIVVTGLFNYVMPLIRYKLGDIGTFSNEKCSCGRGFPLIKSIKGRIDDFLTLPSGKKISPRVINVIENIPGVSRYKTIQETKNRIVVNLVKGEGFCEKTIIDIKKHIKKGCFGENVGVEVKLVKEIPLEKRGKLRAVVSNVRD
jgi:phenylacetate-CoA ligase